MAKAQMVTVDFTDVKDSTGINPKFQDDGEYLLKITKADVTKSKEGDPMVVFLLQDTNDRSAVYPYYCPLTPKVLWKIRTLFINLGLPVPKTKGKLNIGSTVGKSIGVFLEGEEYNGKMKSVITNTFPADELEPVSSDDSDDDDDFEEEDEDVEEAPKAKAKKRKAPEPVEEDDDEDEDDEEDEPAPVVKKSKAKAKPAPVEDEDDDEDEEEEEAPKVSKRTAARRAAKAAAAKAAEEDEDEDEDDEPAPAPKARKKSKPAPVEEDDDDDLDLDEV